MGVVFKILKESTNQAVQQLLANKMRSTLSLLGITIGIFCIIAVKSAVDSLQDNVMGSFEQLGSDVLFVTKLPWNEDPQENYWKYFQRPAPSIEDSRLLEEKLTMAEAVSYVVEVGSSTLKYRGNSIQGASLFAATYDYSEIFKLEMEKGRYFSAYEYANGSNKVILGHTIAEELFGPIEPIGKQIKLKGRNVQVIGIFEKAGDAIVNPMDFDETVMIPYTLGKKMIDVRQRSSPWASQVNVKAKNGVSAEELKDEVTGVLRAHRRLKPQEKDDFSINEISIIASFLDNIFGVINLAGYFIGIFAIFVGMFSVANIMFVTVKERTNLIGIKMALGAKRIFILLEFLIEAIVLCTIGGVLGLMLVYLIMQILGWSLDFDMYLSFNNALLGIVLSVGIGLISGFIPANQASRMDPVEAMRH